MFAESLNLVLDAIRSHILETMRQGKKEPRFPRATAELPEGAERAAFALLERTVADRVHGALKKVALAAGHRMQSRTSDMYKQSLGAGDDTSVHLRTINNMPRDFWTRVGAVVPGGAAWAGLGVTEVATTAAWEGLAAGIEGMGRQLTQALRDARKGEALATLDAQVGMVQEVLEQAAREVESTTHKMQATEGALRRETERANRLQAQLTASDENGARLRALYEEKAREVMERDKRIAELIAAVNETSNREHKAVQDLQAALRAVEALEGQMGDVHKRSKIAELEKNLVLENMRLLANGAAAAAAAPREAGRRSGQNSVQASPSTSARQLHLPNGAPGGGGGGGGGPASRDPSPRGPLPPRRALTGPLPSAPQPSTIEQPSPQYVEELGVYRALEDFRDLARGGLRRQDPKRAPSPAALGGATPRGSSARLSRTPTPTQGRPPSAAPSRPQTPRTSTGATPPRFRDQTQGATQPAWRGAGMARSTSRSPSPAPAPALGSTRRAGAPPPARPSASVSRGVSPTRLAASPGPRSPTHAASYAQQAAARSAAGTPERSPRSHLAPPPASSAPAVPPAPGSVFRSYAGDESFQAAKHAYNALINARQRHYESVLDRRMESLHQVQDDEAETRTIDRMMGVLAAHFFSFDVKIAIRAVGPRLYEINSKRVHLRAVGNRLVVMNGSSATDLLEYIERTNILRSG